MQTSALSAAQNADGGWGYHCGSSWTEPTAYAVLALSTNYAQHEAAVQRAVCWLRPLQNHDGGWRPRPSVTESTWVTALVLLLPEELLGASARQRATEWLMQQTPANAAWVYRLRQWMLGSDLGEDDAGWSWFPGTAAWVTPTSISLLALKKLSRAPEPSRARQQAVTERIQAGTAFLLRHACADGGWNHGSQRALGYDLGPYPETTGTALLATSGVRAPQVAKAIETARKQWPACRSAQGRNWLRLGLMAQGLPDPGDSEPDLPCRTNVDLALCVLADAARGGKNAFLA